MKKFENVVGNVDGMLPVNVPSIMKLKSVCVGMVFPWFRIQGTMECNVKHEFDIVGQEARSHSGMQTQFALQSAMPHVALDCFRQIENLFGFCHGQEFRILCLGMTIPIKVNALTSNSDSVANRVSVRCGVDCGAYLNTH